MSDKLESRRIPYFGDFVLFDEIGRGGMGVVYSAQQTKLDRPVALKVLHSGFASGEAARQRLRIEAEAAAKLDHPNIVPIFEFGEHEGHPYLAMQLIEGESLAEFISRNGANLGEKDAVRLLAKIARAVHHAHQRGVLHRDLKPGNILLDESGEPHLIDFGLAKCLEQDSGMTQTGVFMGTPAYASPEQAAGQNKSITTATDIYSLGAILYALLTGRVPFSGETTAQTIDNVINLPPRLRGLRPALSRDLEVICLKCLEKLPEHRYATAAELAEELGRFVAGEPIRARPVGWSRRAWLWTRRRPAHAALAAGAVIFVAVCAGLLLAAREGRVRETEARNQFRLRQALQQIQDVRLVERRHGWSRRSLAIAAEATKIPGAAQLGELRDQVVAALEGLDAERITRFTNHGATAVCWKPDGLAVLFQGETNGLQIWEGETNSVQNLNQVSPLAVAYAENGTACRLDYDEHHGALRLSEVATATPVREWELPPEIDHAQPPKLVVLSDGGGSGIAVFPAATGEGEIVAHLGETKSLAVLGNATNPAEALAISRDGGVMVCGDREGTVRVWVDGGRRALPTFSAGHHAISGLGLGRLPRTSEHAGRISHEVSLLAIGHSGGLTTLWDVETRTMLRPLPGGHYEVTALAFNFDGTLLAIGGHGPIKLWDAVSGQWLLDINEYGGGGFVTGLSFSPGGDRLAASAKGADPNSGAIVWKLESHRGIASLRGLSGQVSKVCFSPDGKQIAALSHEWDIGVWEVATSRLLRVFEAPEGVLADNAALAFSPDGRRLAFVAGEAARLWDCESGETIMRQELPRGFSDILGYPASNQLLLFRMEHLSSKEVPPTAGKDYCVIRNLLADRNQGEIARIETFKENVRAGLAAAGGRFFVVDSLKSSDDRTFPVVKCFDALNGKEIWSLPTSRFAHSSSMAVDTTGLVVACCLTDRGGQEAGLVDVASGKVLGSMRSTPSAFSQARNIFAGDSPADQSRGLSLTEANQREPLVTLGIDGISPQFVQFSPNQRHLAWGTKSGAVLVCDLERVLAQSRLAERIK